MGKGLATLEAFIVQLRTTHLQVFGYRRSHLQGGKGSGELGQNPWACTEEFPCANEIAALAQSHDKLTKLTARMQHRYTGCIAV